MTPMRGCGLAMELDVVRLHQWIRQELLAHLLHLRPRRGFVRGVDLEVDHLADARAGHGEPEMLERALDRLALRVEDALLRPNDDGRLHPSTTFGFSTYASKGIFVSSSNASTYFERVCMTTSSGSSGPGYVLSHPVVSQ